MTFILNETRPDFNDAEKRSEKLTTRRTNASGWSQALKISNDSNTITTRSACVSRYSELLLFINPK